MRVSLWLLFAAAAAVALLWLMLVVSSNFDIWRLESNFAGLTIQAAPVLSPVALLLGLKLSAQSFGRTAALFALAWTTAVASFVFLLAR